MALDGLERVQWSLHHHAYGQATNVPALLSSVESPDADTRRDALRELWGTVWHQGTVYDCTPLVVPFLIELLGDSVIAKDTRGELTILLASIAGAMSFVDESSSPKMWPAAWQRGQGHPAPNRDLAEECRAAVANHADVLAVEFSRAPRPVRIGLLAVFAAIADRLPEGLVGSINELSQVTDPRIASAAQIVVALAEQRPLDRKDLEALTVSDNDVHDYFDSIEDWPLRVQALEVARELSISAIASPSPEA
jgi:hypothetical protein